MPDLPIHADVIERDNARRTADLTADYDALAAKLARRGVDIAAVTAKVSAFTVALPSWGVGTGGTRFARFPGVDGSPTMGVQITSSDARRRPSRCTFPGTRPRRTSSGPRRPMSGSASTR